MSGVAWSRGGRWGMGGVAFWVVIGWSVAAVVAATPAEQQKLVELCDYGAPDVDADDSQTRHDYHRQRRHQIHDVYETPLPELGAEMLGYDRLSGVLTFSAFRNYQPYPGSPKIEFRNECIVSFEFDEEEVHDLRARIRMGTVEMRLGYQLAARQDYDVDYCPKSEDDGIRALQADLLYVRLVDTELSEDEDDYVIDTYQTRLGHREALRESMTVVDSAKTSMPDVEISDLQWRERGRSWEDGFVGEEHSEVLGRLESKLIPHLEGAVYPCYIGALSKNASLQGAIVLEVPVGAQRDGQASLLVDTIGDSGLRECVKRRVDGFEGMDSEVLDGEVDAFKATMLLRQR